MSTKTRQPNDNERALLEKLKQFRSYIHRTTFGWRIWVVGKSNRRVATATVNSCMALGWLRGCASSPGIPCCISIKGRRVLQPQSTRKKPAANKPARRFVVGITKMTFPIVHGDLNRHCGLMTLAAARRRLKEMSLGKHGGIYEVVPVEGK